MSSFLFWALTGLVCLSPLPLGSNRPLPWSVLALAVGIMLALWGIDRVRAVAGGGRMRRSHREPAAPATTIDRAALGLAVGFAVLFLWYVVQSSTAAPSVLHHPAWAEAAQALGIASSASPSLDPTASRTLAMKIFSYAGVFFLSLQLCRDRQRARFALWAIGLAGFGYALYGLVAKFGGFATILWFPKTAYVESVTSTFINRNSYATYAGLAVIAVLAPLLSEFRRIMRSSGGLIRLLVAVSEEATPAMYAGIAAVCAGLVAVILTGSRAGLMSLALGLAVFWTGMLLARDIRLRTWFAGFAIGAVALAGALTLSGEHLLKRVMDGGPESRGALYEVGRAAMAERPLAGHGLGTFGPAFNRANDGTARFETYVDLAHNTYLELATEAGIPAFLLSLALVGAVVGAGATGLFARGRGSAASIAAVAGAALVGAHAMVDFSVQMPAVAVTFMLMLGAAAAQALTAERGVVSIHPLDVAEAHAESRTGSRRRRRVPAGRRHSDRPLSADDAVTPSPQLVIDAVQVTPTTASGRVDLGALGAMRGARGLAPAPMRPVRPSEAISEPSPPRGVSPATDGLSSDERAAAMRAALAPLFAGSRDGPRLDEGTAVTIEAEATPVDTMPSAAAPDSDDDVHILDPSDALDGDTTAETVEAPAAVAPPTPVITRIETPKPYAPPAATPAPPTTPSTGMPESSDYAAALARWRALRSRPGGVDAATATLGAAGGLGATRAPSVSGATEGVITSLPGRPPAHDGPPSPSEMPQPSVVPFTSGLAPPPEPQDGLSAVLDAGDGMQPPTPTAWPGVTTLRTTPAEDTRIEPDDVKPRRSAEIVELPRGPRAS
ncbi:MAG: O-antigen ligase family protein [Rhodospirillales bacterium]|nr:O-antigen ligase family protein [Rhodospirillales bacterium]